MVIFLFQVCNRNPEIFVEGMLPDEIDRQTAERYTYMLIHPNRITDVTTQREYTLNWQPSVPLVLSPQQLTTDKMKEFKRKVTELLLKPMGTLTFDETKNQWVKCPSGKYSYVTIL